MSDTSRIEELRRRVQRDPTSIAFAQLAEEYRRAGRYKEAIETCEQGLAHHPGYLSARVTLGRSYLEIGELDAAQVELTQVLRAAPENLAALRGMAEIHHRRGELREALAHYRTALEFARNDPELQHLVEEIAKELEPQPAAPAVANGMSFEDVKNTFLNLSLPDDDPEGLPAAFVAPTVGADELAADVPTIDLTGSHADEPFPWPVDVHEGVASAPPAPPDSISIDTPPAESVGAGTLAPAEILSVPATLLAERQEPAAEPAPEPAVPEAAALPEPVAAIETAPAVHVAGLSLSADVGGLPDIEMPAIAPGQMSDHLDIETLSVAPADTPPAAAPPAELVPQPENVPALPADATPGEQADAAAQVDALERWLETIIADRQRRA